jgi:hypothetical protein
VPGSKPSAVRLLADGEEVVDVPPKLSARARVFATGQGRKADATDAHSVALVGTRMSGLRPVVNDDACGPLVPRRTRPLPSTASSMATALPPATVRSLSLHVEEPFHWSTSSTSIPSRRSPLVRPRPTATAPSWP